MYRKGKLHPLTMAGLVFLILASLSLRIRTDTVRGEDIKDAFSGLLYGLAIGCMLFGIWKSTRRPNDSAPRSPER